MDILTFISAVIASVSWPAAIVIILSVLREPIKALIRSGQNIVFKAAGVEVNISSTLQEAERKVREAELPEIQPAVPHITQRMEFDWLYALAESDPRSAILQAWVLIKYEAHSLATWFRPKQAPQRPGAPLLRKSGLSTIQILDLLRQQDVVPESIVSAAANLDSVRSIVAQSEGIVILPEQAESFVNLALGVVSFLHTRSRKTPEAQ